ncbi:MAG: hypothetical protein AB3N14_13220 [Flavobacteriaceae bacterium]
MKNLTYTLWVVLLIAACSPLKNSKTVESHIPSLGAIGQEDKSLFGSLFLQIGHPKIMAPIALGATETPFSKSSFKTYRTHLESKGEEAKITYVDSSKVKPKYLCLEITDKIALQTQLNAEENKSVRNYLSKDTHNMVSKISFVASEQVRSQITDARALFLSQNNHGVLGISVIQRNTTHFLPMSDLETFSFKTSGFCWGKNIYGQLEIDAIVSSDNRCPKGTEEDAYKLTETKSYLKL